MNSLFINLFKIKKECLKLVHMQGQAEIHWKTEGEEDENNGSVPG